MNSDWDNKKTDETRSIETRLGREFSHIDAYRYNLASIRIRIIDPRFEGKSYAELEAMVHPFIMKLPKRSREDVLMLVLLEPGEVSTRNTQAITNLEFENPSRSRF